MTSKLIIIPPSIISEMRKLLSTNISNDYVEVEARFGYFEGSKFTSGVSRSTFNRMKETMIKLNPRFNYTHSKDQIFRESGMQGWPYDRNTTERYTTIYNFDGTENKSYRLIKTRVQNFDVPDYFFRISISKEITDESPQPSLQPIMIREKKRWSYTVFQENFRLDLTEVTAYNQPRNAQTVFEIEIEILGSKLENLNDFEKTVTAFLLEIQGTLIPYKSEEKAAIITRTNALIGASVNLSTRVDIDAIIQPRNLKIRDLSIGGIIPSSNRGVRYTATIKADGKARLLVIDSLGVYLIYSYQVMKIAGASTADRLKGWHGTVFLCEYIPLSSLQPWADSKYKNARIYIAFFDTLAISGDGGVRNKDHMVRLEYAQKFMLVSQKLTTFVFEVKRFLMFSTIEEFYRVVNELLSSTYPFKTDGLIFGPDNYRYDTSVNRMKIYQRVLSKQPDIMKWKPPSELTIDFAIRHVLFSDGNYIELLVSEGRKLVPFSGKPFNPKINIQIVPQLQNAPNNSVIEFKWSNEEFVYIRPRDDKPYPNRQEVALDVWKDIHSPIDEATIRGQKFSLSFRYHGEEKWKLFNMVGRELPPVDGINIKYRTLLDIGSGKGGDSKKWVENGFTHIICVEPNDMNRTELINRLESINQRRIEESLPPVQYKIVATIGQDWETIVRAVREFSPNGFVDAISFMLSLSFFFDSPESTISILNLVNSTLARGGYFFALSIDGRYVLEYFSNASNFIEVNGIRRSYMQLIDFQLRPATPEIRLPHIFINIPDSIVTNQIEYLTNLSELQDMLTKIPTPLVTINEWRTDKELFLLQEEIQYVRLFSAFVMKRT